MAKKAQVKWRATRRKGVHRLPSKINLERIIVPIDFSEHSKKALEYAVPFARQFGASLELLYVVEPTIYPADFSFGQVGFPNVEEELRTRGKHELGQLIKKMIGRRVKARPVVRTGKAFFEIDRYASEEEVDLIIIATHGHTGIEHVLFGSTAEKVIRHAPCPVLVIPSGGKKFVK
jgi:nucleotide-binding universal stress UspA family protein